MGMQLTGKGSLVASSLTAIGASVCCVGPLVLLALGVGGTWVGALTMMEPLRPLFIGLTHRRLGWHLHDQHRDVLLVGVGTGRMRAPEFLDDHRLAVVGRANQQQVGHALFVRPRIQGFQPVQSLDRTGIADPAVGAKALDALVRRQPGQSLRRL